MQRTYAGGSGGRALDWARYAFHTTWEAPMHNDPRPQNHPAAAAAEIATLLVSFELSEGRWVVTMRPPVSSRLSRFSIPARVHREAADPANDAAQAGGTAQPPSGEGRQ